MLAENLDTSKLSRAQKIELIGLLEEKQRREAKRKHLTVYRSFYGWQREFAASTKTHSESCLMAANQVGKTRTGTAIDAIHLLGDYPDDWEGYAFEFPPTCWALGYSMEKTRDLLQTALFGEFINGGFSGGLIPRERVVSWESAIGTPNAMRTVRVKHRLGISTIQFWSYSQGQHALMGDVVDWFHIDEEPKDQAIRPQVLTRTVNGDRGRGGRGIYTFTPENGRTDLVIQFMDSPSDSQFFMKKGWKDAPHITPEKAERMLAQYPPHQRKMRTEGEPMLGHGRIYDIDDELVLCDPFEIPEYWLIINGMDFGWDHPQAHVQLAVDPDNDIVYVTNAWRAREVSANDAWGAVKEWAKTYPCAWPHDGLQNEKGRDDAVQQKVHYDNAGFKMLPTHACWPDVPDGKGDMRSGGNSVEQGVYEIIDRARKGKFRVFRGLVDYMDEWRQYHRDEKGKIVKIRDDILDAGRYAYMMRRFAVAKGSIGEITRVHMPKPIKVMGRR